MSRRVRTPALLLLGAILAPDVAPAQGSTTSRTTEPPAAERTAPRAPPTAARPFGTGNGTGGNAPSRMPRTLNEPLGLAPPRSTGRTQDLAPIPNRDIEAPRDRLADGSAATLEPMLLPPERRTGQTFGREHLRETGPDRPFDMIVPGARLRIPFDQGR